MYKISEINNNMNCILKYYFEDNTGDLISGAIANEIRSAGSELIGEEGVNWTVELADTYLFIGFDRRQDLYALHGYLQDLGWVEFFSATKSTIRVACNDICK